MQEKIRQQAEELWQTEFGDDENFIKRLFDLYYDEEHFFSISHNGYLKVMLFILDYKLLIGGKEYKGAYLYGFCSKPEYRKQGLGKRLLSQTEQRLRKSDFDFIFLIAANNRLIDYYKDLSFVSCNSHQWKEWHEIRQEQIPVSNYRFEISKQIPKKSYHALSSKKQDRVLHTAKDLSLYENTDYDICCMYIGKEICALAVVKSSDEERIVLDVVSESCESEIILLNHISTLSTQRLLVPCVQIADADAESASPYMIKSLSDKENIVPQHLFFNLLLDK